MEYVIAILATALGLLAITFKLQSRRLNEAVKTVKEQGFRLEVIEAQEFIKKLEKKSRESNDLADKLLSDYDPSNSEKPIWSPYDRPGKD